MRGKPTPESQKKQIITLAEEGYKNREIAEHMGISIRTAEYYAANAKKRQRGEKTYAPMPKKLIKEWEALHWKYGMKKTWQQWDEATKKVRRGLWQRKQKKLSA